MNTNPGKSNGNGLAPRGRSPRWKVHRAPEHHEGKSYQAVRQYIRTGDIALFRGKRFLSGVIEHLSDSPYSHIAILATVRGRVVGFQSDLRGVEILPVSKLVCRYDGRVDWWALKDKYRQTRELDEQRLFDSALRLLGVKYAYLRLLGLALRILFGRTLRPGDAHTTPDSLFCSEFVSLCYRQASDGLLDVNKNVNDASTSPADFAASGFFEPRCKLFDGSGRTACEGLFDGRSPRLLPGGGQGGDLVGWSGDPQLEAPASVPAPRP
jgi:hypothetical protein